MGWSGREGMRKLCRWGSINTGVGEREGGQELRESLEEAETRVEEYSGE